MWAGRPPWLQVVVAPPGDGWYSERAVYCAEGAIEIDGVALVPEQMAVLRTGGGVDVLATVPSTVMVLGGEPIGQRYLLWNFVSSSRERLEQAAEDSRQQRMKLPIADDREFTPMAEASKGPEAFS